MARIEFTHFHLFCGLGGGAAGFNRGHARVGSMEASFRCIGGIDVDPAAIRDFEKLAGVSGTVIDLFSRDQYRAFHGCEPPSDWREASSADILYAANGERPNIVFLSAPCKGFSGLLSQAKSASAKYQALNALTLRGIWLMLDAFKDDPAELIIFENVPRIANRGRQLLDQIAALLRSYGYAVAETTHDCGEIGGLAQSRRRFLLVARHSEKVPSFLYEPTKRPLRGVGDILDRMALPGDPAAGPMHRVPALHWKTWVRLAFVQAGSDWRSLNRLKIKDGQLADYLIIPEYRDSYLGVVEWTKPCGVVSGKSLPSNGRYSIADPRFAASANYEGQQYGVRKWRDSTGTVTGQRSPGQGSFSVADPRTPLAESAHRNIYRVIDWKQASKTIVGASHVAGGALSVADPRGSGFAGKYGVTPYGQAAGTVISGSTTGQGAFAVADPRSSINRLKGDHYLTGGHYGVLPWDAPSYAVAAAACHDNGNWSVADPRAAITPMEGPSEQTQLPPAPNDRLSAIIIAEDNTWHRPFTTLELAALQGLYDPEEDAVWLLEGASDSGWRERIGNAVPPPAATAIASMMAEALLLSMAGETFQLSSTPVWVRPIAIAMSLADMQRAVPQCTFQGSA